MNVNVLVFENQSGKAACLLEQWTATINMRKVGSSNDKAKCFLKLCVGLPSVSKKPGPLSQ